MTNAVRYGLGINTSFAVKRWPEPDHWAALIHDLGVDLVQHTFDLVDLDGPSDYIAYQASATRAACDKHELFLHSSFTGLAAYSSNLLLHPDRPSRERAEDWYRRAIDFTSLAGATCTGGHLGAFSVSDWQTRKRKSALQHELDRSLDRLSGYAQSHGLNCLLVENMAAAREPSTMEWMKELLRDGDDEHAPIALCLDVGHQCVPGTAGAERDPYAWLQELGSAAPVVHLQQTDATADHHWPFTSEANEQGRIRPDDVLAALDRSGATEVALILEVVPPFEEHDRSVMKGIADSVEYWREALRRHG